MCTTAFVNKAVLTSNREEVYVYEKMIPLINRTVLRGIQDLEFPSSALMAAV